MKRMCRRAIFYSLVAGGLLFWSLSGSCEASELLPEVRVTASPLDEAVLEVPGTLEVIYPEATRGEAKTLGDLLEQAAGVQVIRARGRGGYTVATVRGSTSAQVMLYLDGMRMNLESDGGYNLEELDAAQIARIEIYRGHIPARFGLGGMGAVIQVITRAPEKASGGGAELQVGALGERRLSGYWTSPFGGGRLLGEFSLENYDGDFSYRNDNGTAYNPGDDYEAARQHNGHEGEHFLLRWEKALWKVRLGWNARDQQLPLPAPGNDKGPWDARGNPLESRVETERFDGSISTERFWGEVRALWRLDYTSQVREFFDPWDQMGMYGQEYNRYDTERTGLSAVFSTLAGERHALECRMEWSTEELRFRGDVLSTLEDRYPARDRTNLVLQDSIFLLPSQTLVVEPLLRWNRVDGEDHLSWSLGMSWNFREGWYLKGSGGYSHRAPNLYETYGDGSMIVPNEDLEWEEGFQWDLGLHRSWSGEGWSSRVGLTYFQMDMENLIEFVMINPRYGVYQNIGSAFVQGAELESAFAWGKWNASLSCTWMEGENRSPGYRYGKPLPNRPEHALYARLSRPLSPSLRAFGEISYTGENYFDDSGQILYGDITECSLGIKWAFREEGMLSLGVRDIFDATGDVTFQPVGTGPERLVWYPLPGRTWYLSLSWRF